jgi:PDZ domain-containing protein
VRRLLLPLVVLALLAGVAVARGDVPCGLLEAQPACHVALRPGPTEDTLSLVSVEGASVHPTDGELRLTTIAVDEQLGWGEWFRARGDNAVEAVPRERIYPPGSDRTEVAEQNAALMADSQLTATVAALRELGYELEGDGARVAAVAEDAVTDELEPGDIITGLDELEIRESLDVVEAVVERTPGDAVTLTVTRDDEAREVVAELATAPDDPDRPYLGVFLTTELDLPVDVRIDAGVIGGPSAGLMFALSIVELLAPEDLTGGAMVAGTGTLTADGDVGGVGGVRQKVVAASTGTADDEPASVFLVPRDNLEEARSAPVHDEVLVVPVDTLEDAVEALEELQDGRTPMDAIVAAPAA